MKIEIAAIPEFTRGSAFREMSPQEGRYRYRYVTARLVRLRVNDLVSPRCVIVFKDAKGREWLRIDQFGILIAEGYAWNGCSPKRWIPLLGWIGTPDFDCTLLGSLIHDALYQFHATRHFPDELDREACDTLFRDLLEQSDAEELAEIYFRAVRHFGTWSHRCTQGEYSEILTTP